MTIKEAIIAVLKSSDKSMSASEIYEQIVAKKLYAFKAQNPASIVSSEIRRHCLGVNYPKATREKCFKKTDDGKYILVA